MSAFWQQGMGNGLWADIFFTTFTTVRTAILTPVIMIMVFTMLRLAGQRSLTEQTLFNRITLVAIGSLVGGSALRPNTPLVSILVATVIIIGFTVAVNKAYSQGWIPGPLLRPQPVLLWVNGHFIAENMQHCQLTQDKFNSELRQKGYVSLSKVFAVTLEPPGKFAVMTKSTINEADNWDLLKDVRGYEEHLRNLDEAKARGQAPNGSCACLPLDPTLEML